MWTLFEGFVITCVSICKNISICKNDCNFLETQYFLTQFFPNHIYVSWNVQKWGRFAEIPYLGVTNPPSNLNKNHQNPGYPRISRILVVFV